jgi:phosphatidylglycerophosphate synthase
VRGRCCRRQARAGAVGVADTQAHAALITRAGLIGGAVYLVLTALWLVLAAPPGPRVAYEVWFIVLVVVGTRLPGPANQVTLARAYLALPGLVYGLQPGGLGALAVTVALASVTDLLDGTVARRFAQPSELGGALDPVVDGIFFGAVAVGLAVGGAYPLWLALVVVLRYVLPALVGGVLVLAGRRPALTHTLFGQVSTTLIAVLLGWVALFRGLGQDTSLVVAAAAIVIPVSTLLVFANLAWANRAALRGVEAVPGG